MADDVDRAAERAQIELERAIAAARRVPTQSGDPKDSADTCIECGNLIPSERQIALPGVDTCVDCADLIERGLL